MFLVISLIRDKWVIKQKNKNKKEKFLRNSINNICDFGKKKYFIKNIKKRNWFKIKVYNNSVLLRLKYYWIKLNLEIKIWTNLKINFLIALTFNAIFFNVIIEIFVLV